MSRFRLLFGRNPASPDGKRPRLAALTCAWLIAYGTSAPAFAGPPLPTGGSVTTGNATISQSGSTLNVNQSTNQAIVNWQSFSIGQGGTVNFNQPSASSSTLNRVSGSTPSTIAGTINAPGTVLLVNPNGIAITRSGVVNTGSFAASTLNIKDSDYLAGTYKFTGNGGSAAVTNAGRINVSDGGFAALLGGQVANSGVISARLGKVGLGAGELITLDLAGDGFLSVAVPSTQLGKLVDGNGALVTNSGKIRANGGQVFLSAATAANILRDAVNVPGSIRANSVGTRNGRIVIGGGSGGTVRIAGRIDTRGGRTGNGGTVSVRGSTIDISGKVNASAKAAGSSGGTVSIIASGTTAVSGSIKAEGGNGGRGGFIETSGEHLLIAESARISTVAQNGVTGTWLIDPQDFIIAASGGDISGATLSANLATTDVTIMSANGLTAGNGDIFVNDAVSWTSTHGLTLNAVRNININSAISGASGALTLTAGSSGTISAPAAVNVGSFQLTSGNWVQNTAALPSFSAGNFAVSGGSFLRVTGGNGSSGTPYQIADVYGLQGIGTSSTLRSQAFALANDIDASGTTNWNSGAGFAPIGVAGASFQGSFDGKGHVITGLTINRPSTTYVGLFGDVGNATISNVGLIRGSVSGSYAGALAGRVNASAATISQVYSDLTVTGSLAAGGLIGLAQSSSAGTGLLITQSYSSGSVSVTSTFGGGGGLIGTASVGGGGAISIAQTYATGSVTAASGSSLGGLVGTNFGAAISQSYASGRITGGSGTNTGGLVGVNNSGSVTTSYWDKTASGQTQGTAANGGIFSATGLTGTQPFTQATYSGWDFTNTWYIVDGSTRPFLRMEASTGTIYNAHQLQLIGMNATTLTRTYTLANDINLGTALSNASDMWGSAGFVPIGTAAIQFNGTFDGAYHIISGLTINRPTTDYVGLFSVTGNATIARVGLTGVNIVGQDHVGALGGNISGSVSDSFATGTVSGRWQVGGLIGQADDFASTGAQNTRLYANVAVTATGGQGGGLIGQNNIALTQAYSAGRVTGGGIGLGGLIGQGSGTVTNGYYDSTTAGLVQGAGVAMTTGQLQSALPSGFDSNWGNIAGRSYPYLKAFYPSGTPQVISGTVYSNFFGTTAAGATVYGLVNGVSVGNVASGANGYYNLLVAPNTLPANSQVVTYTTGPTGGMAYQQNAMGSQNAMNIAGGWLIESSPATTMSAISAGLATAVGASGASTTYANRQLIPSAANFTIDQAINQTGALRISANGNITQAAGAGSALNVGILQLFNNGGGAPTFSLTNTSNVFATLGVASLGNGSLNLYDSADLTLATVTANGGVQIQSAGSLTLSNSRITSSAGGDAVVLVAGTSFRNASDSSAISLTGAGRFLVYSQNPANDVAGGLTGGTIYNSTYAANPPASISATGNQFIYASAAPVTLITYAVADASSTYSTLATLGDATLSGNPSGVTAIVSLYDSNNNLVTLSSSLNAGTYYERVTGLSGSNAALYQIASTGNTVGTLIIGRVNLTGTVNSASRTYDGTAFSGGNGVTYSGFVNGETASVLGGTLTYGGGSQGAINAGSYVLSGSGQTSQNYNITYQNATLTITPRPLNVSATTTLSKIYDNNAATDPAMTYSVAGLISGDVLSGSLTRVAGQNAGSYAINQGTLGNANYAITYTGANFTINPRALTVTATTLNKTYDNNAATDPAMTYSIAGLVPGENVTGALARAAGENAGIYAIGQGTLTASSNYTMNFTGANLTINPRTLNVSATTLNKLYDNNPATDPALTYSSSGLVPGDVLSGSLTRAAGQNAGTYAIGQGTLAASSNYTMNFTGANLTISPRAVVVMAAALNKTYDNNAATDPAMTYSVAGLVSGESLTGALTRAAGENAGTYAISQGTLAASSNYTMSFTGANLTISPRTLSVTANPLNRTYGGTDPALTYSVNGLVSGESLTGALTRAAGENAGTYAITQGTLAASSNYAMSYTGANLTINQAPLYVNVGSSRVDLQACKLEYSIVSPK